MAGAIRGEVLVSLFVAGIVFGEMQVLFFVAGEMLYFIVENVCGKLEK